MKPATVRIRLRFASLPWLVADTREYLAFGIEANALTLTRGKAAKTIRLIRSWGGYKPEVVSP